MKGVYNMNTDEFQWNKDFTIADVEKRHGIVHQAENQSSLERWYEKIRKLPISQLTSGDIARRIRQQIFLKEIMPVAIKFIGNNPLAGDYYEGEILIAISKLNKIFWEQHNDLFNVLKKTLKNLLNDKNYFNNKEYEFSDKFPEEREMYEKTVREFKLLANKVIRCKF